MAKVAFPFFHRLNFFTVYEYLEARFDVRVRTLAALIFILWRLGWMATAMYVPSLAINAATGGEVDLNTMTIVVGVVVTAVHDARRHPGGDLERRGAVLHHVRRPGRDGRHRVVERAGRVRRNLVSVAAAAGKLDLWPPLVDPATTGVVAQVVNFFHQPMNVIALMVALVVGRMAQYTSDQVMVQRLQTTRSLKEARQAFVVNAAGDALWMIGLSFVGLALFAYFQRHALPPEFQTDKLLPYFMSLAFPAGAVGLVIAAIMAASLSSIDSAINSCTSVAVVDLYNRVWKGTRRAARRALGRRATRAGARLENRDRVVRRARHGAGVQRVEDRIAARDQRQGRERLHRPAVRHLPAGDVQRPRPQRGRAVGRAWPGRSPRTTWPTRRTIGFMWPSTFGLAATLVSGYLLTLLWPAPAAATGRDLTWWAVMRRPDA